MSGGLVTIGRYRDLPDAWLAKSRLEAAGITCFLEDEYTIGVNWLYSNVVGGVKLTVPEESAKEARALLDEVTKPEAVEGARSDPGCPACGATEIETSNYTRRFAALSLLVSLPLPLFGKRYRCGKCGHRWK